MSMKIKGITIELNADTTGLEKALKEVNKSLSTTQHDLREVNKALELDPENVELVEQKSRLLSKAIEDTTKKLEALKEAQGNISEEDTEKAQRQYDALTREISKTTVQLEKLNEEQEAFDEEMKSSQESTSAFASGLSKVGEAAESVARKTAAISAAAAGALTAIIGLIKQSSDAAAGWTKTAAEIGFTAEGVQRLEYASAAVGVEMNDITGAIQNMNDNLGENESAFKRIGVRVRDNNGEYRDSERIFYETVAALGQIENETERNQRATQIFGDNAAKIAPAFQEGGKALREMAQEAQNSGSIVSNQDVDSLAEFNHQLESTKVMLTSAFANVGASALQALAPVFEKVANAARVLAQILSRLSPETVQVITVALMLVAAIAPVASIISNITGAIMGMIQITPYVIAGIKAIEAALTSTFSNPYVLLIMAIVAALALLAAAIYLNWDDISSGAEAAFDEAKGAVTSATNSIKGVLSSFAQKARAVFDKAAEAVRAFETAIDDLSANIKAKIDKVVGTVEKLKEAFSGLGGKIKNSIGNMGDIFGGIGGDAQSAGARVMQAFAAGITGAISAVKNAIQQLASAIDSLWASMTGSARNAGTQTANAYADGFAAGRKPQASGLLGAFNSGGSSGGSYSSSGFLGSAAPELLGAINTLNDNLELLGSSNQPTNVNVQLVGSAANIFDTVRVQNSKMVNATGYHALA